MIEETGDAVATEVDVVVSHNISSSFLPTSIKALKKQPSGGRWKKFPRKPNDELVSSDLEEALDISSDEGVPVSEYLSELIHKRREQTELAQLKDQRKKEMEELSSLAN